MAGSARPAEFPASPGEPPPASRSAPKTPNGRIETRNPDPIHMQNTTGHPGIRMPHGRTNASTDAIPIAAIPTVTALSTTHSAMPNPWPTGSNPMSEPTTQDTLISRYGNSAKAPP